MNIYCSFLNKNYNKKYEKNGESSHTIDEIYNFWKYTREQWHKIELTHKAVDIKGNTYKTIGFKNIFSTY